MIAALLVLNSYELRRPCLKYLNGHASSGDDLLHSDGGALRQGHLPVGGLLRGPAQRQLPATAAGIAKRTGRERLAVPDDIIVQRRRHALTNQEKPAGTKRRGSEYEAGGGPERTQWLQIDGVFSFEITWPTEDRWSRLLAGSHSPPLMEWSLSA